MKKFVLSLTSLLAVSALSIPTASAASDVFNNYAELSSHYQLGKDYIIETNPSQTM